MPAHPLPENFEQLKLLFTDPVQFDYEAIRPIILGADTLTERSTSVGIERSVLGDKAHRFLKDGMAGLFDQRSTNAGRKRQSFPEPVAAYILYLKQLYPPIRYREIVRILERRFGYHTNHHTVKHFLDNHPIPIQLPLTWTTYHEFEDAYRARWTVVRMHYEGSSSKHRWLFEALRTPCA